MTTTYRTVRWAALAALMIAVFAVPVRADEVPIGAASQYAILYEGDGGHNLSITNVTINGNVGVGGSGKVQFNGPGTIKGRLDFSASNSGQFSDTNGSNVGPTSVNYNVAGVTNALNSVNSLNAMLGAEAGTSININLSGSAGLSVNASAGTLDAHGNRIFDVTGFNTTNGNTITINGDAAGDNVVFNFIGLNANFNNQVKLVGLNSDQVLFNFVGGMNFSGGPTLQINDNASASSSNMVEGIFLNPNGAVSVVNADVQGRVFGGDSHDMQIVSGDTITAPAVVPEPATFALIGTGIVALVRRRKEFSR